MRSFTFIPILLVATAGLYGQEDSRSWTSEIFVGRSWTCTHMTVDDTAEHVERTLSPLLPSFLNAELRNAPHPHGRMIADQFARSLGLDVRETGASASERQTKEVLLDADREGLGLITAEAYLRVRLLDVLVGDWSREEEDITWKVVDGRYIPHPRSYDNGFPVYKGLLPWVVLQASDHMTSWSDDAADALARPLRLEALDRRILSTLPHAAWDSVVGDFVATGMLALDRILAEHDEACLGADFARSLERRLKTLPSFARAYERRLAQFVEYHGSTAGDTLTVRIIARGAIEVSARDHPGRSRPPRLFNAVSTREVRFHMKDGNDLVLFEGQYTPSFRIIIDEGRGTTAVRSRRYPTERWISSIPGNVDRYRTSTIEEVRVFDDAWGSRVTLLPWVLINPDDGMMIGLGPDIRTSAYRSIPYATRTTALVGFATSTRRYRLDVEHTNTHFLAGVQLGLSASYSQLEISNFFGLGNETVSSSLDLASGRFKADQRLIRFGADISTSFTENAFVSVFGSVRSLRTDPRPGSLIDSLIDSGYDRRLNYGGIGLRSGYASEVTTEIMRDGWRGEVEVQAFPAMLQNQSVFVRGLFRVEAGWSPIRETSHLRFRFAAEAVRGDHPWFESVFLGGSRNLRGFERQRFAGDASLFGGLESRTILGSVRALWLFEVGGLAFVESGRVFESNASSKRWHSSVGLGGWLRPLRSAYVVECALAYSAEMTSLYARFSAPVSAAGVRSFFD